MQAADGEHGGLRIGFGPRLHRCPYCHEAVHPSDEKAACDACMAWQHAPCWDESGAHCASCGARRALASAPTRTAPDVVPGAVHALAQRLGARIDRPFVVSLVLWSVAFALAGVAIAAWTELRAVGQLAGLGALVGALFGATGGLSFVPAPDAEDPDDRQDPAPGEPGA